MSEVPRSAPEGAGQLGAEAIQPQMGGACNMPASHSKLLHSACHVNLLSQALSAKCLHRTCSVSVQGNLGHKKQLPT